ncbi:hypothetical protein [Kutzneria sp. NPDC052558]|uniref:hypothetical protein n=1 Tax=Kutzneria sp. NPDC052558 TaxID=3364121 RepID=UPI0037CC6C8F
MTRNEFEDDARWELVRPAGLLGLIETLVSGIERWICSRARAHAMAEVASAVASAGVRAEALVVENPDAYWTLTVTSPIPDAGVVAAESGVRHG